MPEDTLMPEDERMCTLITEIVKALVDEDTHIRVEALAEQDTMILRLHTADSDVGKLIGKQGRTARSLRTILSATSMKYKRRYVLDIVGGKPASPGSDYRQCLSDFVTT